jgi:peptide subunit release factor 1 (eRF1)
MEPGTSVKDILTHSCRICSSPIIENEKMDITEELMHLAYHIHAKTVFISDDFDMGSKFLPDYGGIGAILRYRTGY